MSSWQSSELVVSGSFRLAQQPTQEQLARIQSALAVDNAPSARSSSPARPSGLQRLSSSLRLREDDSRSMLSIFRRDGPEPGERTLDALAVVDRWTSNPDRR